MYQLLTPDSFKTAAAVFCIITWIQFIGTTASVIGSLAYLTKKHGLAWKMLHKMYAGLLMLVIAWIAIWLSTGTYDPEMPFVFFLLSCVPALVGVIPASVLFPLGWRNVYQAHKRGITGAEPKKKPKDATKGGPDAAGLAGGTRKQQASRPYNARYQSHKKYLQQKR
nr:hypothetical protein [Candidatus Sigynarchaeum springense]